MKEQPYFKVNAIYQKLRKAERDKSCLYIHSPVGFGKTAAVKYYFRNRQCLWLSGIGGALEKMPIRNEIHQDVVIVDDISWITNPVSRQYICMLVAQNEKQVVLIGRSRLPVWLTGEYLSERIVQADEHDLLLDKTHVQRLLKVRGGECTEDAAEQLLKDTKGFALGILLIMQHMKQNGSYNEAVLAEARLDLYHYFDNLFFELWKEEIKNILLSVAEYESFDVELAKSLSGNSNVPVLLEYAYSVGDFLITEPDGRYRMRPLLREYLIWKQKIVWSEEKRREIHERAADYYESNDDIPLALLESKRIPSQMRIIRLLIKNAGRHAGIGQYYETKDYYFSLPESIIEQYPALMEGLCLLYSLIIQPEKSEFWYDKLVEFEKNPEKEAADRKQARSLIAYLDIVLPHRGIGGITEIIKNTATFITSRNIHLPEFSVTGDQPGIMNGAKDFCEWSRNDDALAKLMKVPLEVALGVSGAGLVNIALAESLFEKSSMDYYEIVGLLNRGYALAEAKGKIEICFAALGVLTSINVFENQSGLAEQQLLDFEKRVIRENGKQLLPNLHALKVWVELQRGDLETVKDWIQKAPSEIEGFFTLDRYQYIMKLRSYLALGRFDEARSLSERLDYYFTTYERHYMWMENTLLRAILCYRLGRPQWKELFEAAYKKAEDYLFVWVIAKEGIAVLPLLEEWSREQNASDKFYKLVKQKTKAMAFRYPRYLAGKKVLLKELTQTERNILKLHSSGMNTKEIMELCGITERTLKFHNSNIYRKLSVKNKGEAILTAQQLGLVD